MTELIQKLTAAYGPSGREAGVSEELARRLEARGITARRDAMGNLIAKVGGSGKKLVFMAHMDTVGLMLTRIDQEGFGSFTAVGWLDPASIAEQLVRFPNGTEALICVREEKLGKELKEKDLFLDFGTGGRAETEQLVSVGDVAVFQPRFLETETRIFSSFLDNRAGCAILLAALEQIKAPKNEIYFVFSTQEEVGLRGAGPGAYGIQGDYGVVVDVTDTKDTPGSLREGTTELGKGAGIKILDRSSMSRPQLIAAMETAAEREGILVQRDIMTGGGTDAGPMASTGRGMAVGGISLPCRYTHSPVETCDKRDLEACARLVAALAETEIEA